MVEAGKGDDTFLKDNFWHFQLSFIKPNDTYGIMGQNSSR